MHVSHETIYNAIYAHPKGELRKALIQCLRQGRSTRRPRLGGQDRRGPDPRHGQHPPAPARGERPHLAWPLGGRPHQRRDEPLPAWACCRAHHAPGAAGAHARCDGRVGAGGLHGQAQPDRAANASVADLRPRARDEQAPGACAQHQHPRVLLRPAQPRGKRAAARTPTGCCASSCPRARTLSVHDQEALDSIADLLNNRPRQTLGWRSPIQAFAELMRGIEQQAQATLH
jgi:IS30 family transposase